MQKDYSRLSATAWVSRPSEAHHYTAGEMVLARPTYYPIAITLGALVGIVLSVLSHFFGG